LGMTYQATLDFLYAQLPMFQRIGAAAYKPDLSNTIALCQALKIPHENLKCIHVAGTNGKGSTSHMIASIFQEAGYKVGLYTSPHLLDFRERIKINGKPISRKFVVNFTQQHLKLFEKIKPSFFEMTVALCFQYFKEKKVDIAIIETGLGGRLDSTNVIKPLLSVITNISLDHTQFLGNSITQIATEKAGIIKQNTPIVIGEKQNESSAVFLKTAQEKKAHLVFASQQYKIKAGDIIYSKRKLKRIYSVQQNKNIIKLKSELCGNYQSKNIATVLQSISSFQNIETKFKISKNNILNGIENVITNTGLLGRWQVVNAKPLTICDTGHNEAGIKEIVLQLKSIPYRELHIVIGMVNDKDITKVLSQLPKNAIYYFTKAKIPRALDPKTLQGLAKEKKLQGDIYQNVKTAYNSAKKAAKKKDLIFIGGSTFIVADFLKFNRIKNPPRQT
jgi:dihydrofolate synthase / folylpolyglutamate synthase